MSFLDALLRATTARAIATTGDSVDVAAAPPPSAGDVLTAVDATHAGWASPGGALLFLPGIVVAATAPLVLGGITRAKLTTHHVTLTVPAGVDGDRFGIKLVASLGSGPPWILQLAATGTDVFENPSFLTFDASIELGDLPGLYVEFQFDAATADTGGEGSFGIWQLMNYKAGHWLGGG